MAYRETLQRGSAIAEARRSSASNCLSRSARTMSRIGQFGERAVIETVAWEHRLRALRRLRDGERAIGRSVLMSGLSSVLKGIANKEVSERSISSAEGASVTSPRPDGVTGYTGCTVETAQLRNAFREQPLSPVFLNHVQLEAVVGDCDPTLNHRTQKTKLASQPDATISTNLSARNTAPISPLNSVNRNKKSATPLVSVNWKRDHSRIRVGVAKRLKHLLPRCIICAVATSDRHT